MFVHVPKNAGTTIKRYLKNNGIHVSPRHIPYKMLPASDFSFGVVRNPWDRHVSIFLHLKKLRLLSVNASFEDYLKRQWGIFSTSQFHFLDGVKYVLRFENLEEDFKIVQKHIGVFEPLKKVYPFNNSTEHGNYKNYYNSETVEIVERISRKDIEFFGYVFGLSQNQDQELAQELDQDLHQCQDSDQAPDKDMGGTSQEPDSDQEFVQDCDCAL